MVSLYGLEDLRIRVEGLRFRFRVQGLGVSTPLLENIGELHGQEHGNRHGDLGFHSV